MKNYSKGIKKMLKKKNAKKMPSIYIHSSGESYRIDAHLYVRNRNNLGFDISNTKGNDQLQLINITTIQAKMMVKQLEDYINLRENVK